MLLFLDLGAGYVGVFLKMYDMHLMIFDFFVMYTGNIHQ